MAHIDVWYDALCVLADYSPPTYWQMANGAAFWWTLSDRAQLLPDRFAHEPFDYSEIISVTVFQEVQFGTEFLGCDWVAVRDRLCGIPDIQAEAFCDLSLPPAKPPNLALRLSTSTD